MAQNIWQILFICDFKGLMYINENISGTHYTKDKFIMYMLIGLCQDLFIIYTSKLVVL